MSILDVWYAKDDDTSEIVQIRFHFIFLFLLLLNAILYYIMWLVFNSDGLFYHTNFSKVINKWTNKYTFLEKSCPICSIQKSTD